MRDLVTSWVRTVVPGLWAALVAWLVSLGLPEAYGDVLGGMADELLVPLALAAVYGAIRWLEPRVPAWLARLLVGSEKQPSYPATTDGRHTA